MNIYGTIDTFPFTRFFFSAHFFPYTHRDTPSLHLKNKNGLEYENKAQQTMIYDRNGIGIWVERRALLHTVLFPFFFLRSTTCHHRHHHDCRHRHGGCGALFCAFFCFRKSKSLWLALPPLTLVSWTFSVFCYSNASSVFCLLTIFLFADALFRYFEHTRRSCKSGSCLCVSVACSFCFFFAIHKS